MPFAPGRSGNALTQFQPGQSGNPSGGPTGPHVRTILRKLLDKEIDYKDPTTGEYVRGTIEENAGLALLARACDGDVNAYKEIMDRVYGKVTDKSEVVTTSRKITRRIGGRA